MEDNPATELPNLDKILENSLYPDPKLSEEDQQRFVNGFSFSALILQFVYYFAMGDQLFGWLSLLCSIVFIFSPLLLVFPFYAKRRAYRFHKWLGFNEFYWAQKKWDRSTFWILALALIIGVIAFSLLMPLLLNSLHSVVGPTDSNASFNQQVQDSIKQYQNVLGQ